MAGQAGWQDRQNSRAGRKAEQAGWQDRQNGRTGRMAGQAGWYLLDKMRNTGNKAMKELRTMRKRKT